MKSIKLNFITYDLKGITGKVEQLDKSSNTHVFGSGGSNNQAVNITSVNVVSDDIYLTDKNGKEHLFRLKNYNVACRAGNTLTVVSTNKQGKKEGRNLVVINHNAERMFFHEFNVKRLCAPNKYLLFGIFLIISFIALASSRQFGNAFPFIMFVGVVAAGYYFIMQKINERKLKEAIIPAEYL